MCFMLNENIVAYLWEAIEIGYYRNKNLGFGIFYLGYIYS